MRDELKVVPSNRQVLENKLLAALDDETKAAILVTVEDLDLLTDALEFASHEMTGSKHQAKFGQWFEDLCKLRKAAFGARN